MYGDGMLSYAMLCFVCYAGGMLPYEEGNALAAMLCVCVCVCVCDAYDMPSHTHTDLPHSSGLAPRIATPPTFQGCTNGTSTPRRLLCGICLPASCRSIGM